MKIISLCCKELHSKVRWPFLCYHKSMKGLAIVQCTLVQSNFEAWRVQEVYVKSCLTFCPVGRLKVGYYS